MVNYLGNFQSLFEISIALNSAFIILNAISKKLQEVFEQYIKHIIKNTLIDIENFEDESIIQLKQIDIDKKKQKNFEEKIQDIKANIGVIKSKFDLEKIQIFDRILKNLKNLYIIVVTYAIYILFFSGHLSNENASMHTSFAIFIIFIVTYIIYAVFSSKLTLFKIPIHITIAFLFIIFTPYLLNSYFACEILNNTFTSYFKIITYLSVAILFFPTFYGFSKFIHGKNILKSKFTKQIDNATKDIDELKSDIKEITTEREIAENAKKSSDLLIAKLSKKLDK